MTSVVFGRYSDGTIDDSFMVNSATYAYASNSIQYGEMTQFNLTVTINNVSCIDELRYFCALGGGNDEMMYVNESVFVASK